MKHRILKQLLTFLLVLGSLTSYGQAVAEPELAQNRRLSVILDLGTTPGLELAYKLKPKLTARLGFHYFVYQINNSLEIGGEKLKLAGDLGMGVPSASVAFTPRAEGFFKLVGGLAYIANGKLTTIFGPEGSYEFQGNTFTSAEIGEVHFSMDYSQTVAPFLGLGIGRDIPQKRIGVGAELGSYYLSAPKISLTGTERLVGMSEEQAKIEENTKDWRFWPVLNVRVAFKL